MDQLPLPFEKETFDYVLCQDVLEHLQYIPVLRDIWRIMRPSAILHVRVPHFTCSVAFGDPTHKSFFAAHTFCFFLTGGSNRSYYFDFSFSDMQRLHICFGPRLFRPIEWLVNSNGRMQHLYETSPLRIFPATNIEVDLIK
jgi:ubiquinone/menaquinone biosynthesis C-methylase UbiE